MRLLLDQYYWVKLLTRTGKPGLLSRLVAFGQLISISTDIGRRVWSSHCELHYA